ncbi:DUF2167 domain-containing protein [Coraliomargarita sp. W4R53]
MNLRFLNIALISILASTLGLFAQNAQDEPELTAAEEEAAFLEYLSQYHWQAQGSGELGSWATVEIPSGFRFLGGEETDQLMQAFGNLPDVYEGMLGVPNMDWFVLFQFQDTGYVKDDEKDDLNAAKLLRDIQEGDEASNEYRRQNGLEALYTVGWAIKPRYNEQTNNLEWGLLLRGESGGESVNYNTKLLGRDGIMNVTLVCDPDDLDSILGTYQNLLVGYNYQSGKSYAEFEEGDKIAEYGLTALIAGGALYGAAKLGVLANLVLFFKKGFKFIIAGVVAIGAGIKKFFVGKGMDRPKQ